MSSNKKKTKVKEIIFLCLILLPLLWINVRESHDWGGDFALYIRQGMNVVEGKPQGDNKYVFNEYFPYLAPPTYSVGFPLLLAPVYACFGNSIWHFSIFLSVLLIVTLVSIYIFLRRYFSEVISGVAVVLIAYNPWLLWFKCEVLSEIPFTLFFMLSLNMYLSFDWGKNHYGKALILGFLCGYALLIKSIGIVLLMAFFLDNVAALYRDLKQRVGYSRVYNACAMVAGAAFLYILLSKVLLPGKEDSYTFFSTLFVWETWGDIALNTSQYYLQVFQQFFSPYAGAWGFATIILSAFAVSFFLLGVFLKVLERRTVIDYILFLYLGIVISFPNTTQGFRYLFPLCGIFFYYMIHSFQSVRVERKISATGLSLFIAVAVLLIYKPSITDLINQNKSVLQGPQEPEAIEAFEFVRSHVPMDQVLVFNKPTVSGLYTDRNSIGYYRDQDQQQMDTKFEELNVHYILECSDLKTLALDNYLERHKEALDTLFTNGKFRLYYKK